MQSEKYERNTAGQLATHLPRPFHDNLLQKRINNTINNTDQHSDLEGVNKQHRSATNNSDYQQGSAVIGMIE